MSKYLRLNGAFFICSADSKHACADAAIINIK